ncbi:MAG: hypothetical protein ACR2GN_06940 [Bacteroidia bacterium]
MAAIDTLRNKIINKLLTITNKDYLHALNKILENSPVEEDVMQLTEEQILMLQLSEDDIKHNRVISHEELDKEDLKWLKKL